MCELLGDLINWLEVAPDPIASIIAPLIAILDSLGSFLCTA